MTHPLLARAQREGTPLIDGNLVTFLWQGDTPAYLKGDFSRWQWEDAPVAEPLTGQLWQYTLELPDDAYVEYAFFTDTNHEQSRVNDPLNSRLVFNGVEHFNHYFDMPASRHTTLTRYRRGTPRGRVSHHLLTQQDLAIGKRRDVWLYQPPVSAAVPLLFVYDGKDYYRRGKLTVIVDNLIAQGKMAPVALVMIDNARQFRFAEYHSAEATFYTLSRAHALALQHLNVIDIGKYPGSYGVMGASLGGLMALYTGLRLPTYIGKVLSQAGAFDIRPVPESAPLIEELVSLLPTQPLNIWQDCGTLDWLLATNHAMKSRLQDKGYPVTYCEYPAGHNFTAWRDVLPEALATLFPPS